MGFDRLQTARSIIGISYAAQCYFQNRRASRHCPLPNSDQRPDQAPLLDFPRTSTCQSLIEHPVTLLSISRAFVVEELRATTTLSSQNKFQSLAVIRLSQPSVAPLKSTHRLILDVRRLSWQAMRGQPFQAVSSSTDSSRGQRALPRLAFEVATRRAIYCDHVDCRYQLAMLETTATRSDCY